MYSTVKAKIHKKTEKGTYLYVLVPDGGLDGVHAVNNIYTGELRLDDGRYITADQRKKIYATVADFSVYCGYPPEEMKEIMKYQFIATGGADYFSLADCSITTAKQFITYLLDFALEWNVPLSETLVDRCDDIDAAIYSSLRHRRCVLCGKPGEIHHWDAIGRGFDRNKFDDSGLRKLCLCRQHHSEAHNIGRDSFEQKYHVYGIIFNG